MNNNKNEDALTVAKKGILLTKQPELVYKFARILEQSGAIDEAMAGYKVVLMADVNHLKARYYLALLLMDCGEIDRAVEQLRKLKQIDPKSPVTLELQMAFEAKQTSIENDFPKTETEDKSAVKASVSDVESVDSSKGQVPPSHGDENADENPPQIDLERRKTAQEDVKIEAGKSVQEINFSATDDQVDLFLYLFQGRDGVHAVQWLDEKGRGGYSPVHEPLDKEKAKAHLGGKITLGVYPLMEGDRVCFMAIDIDVNKKALERLTN